MSIQVRMETVIHITLVHSRKTKDAHMRLLEKESKCEGMKGTTLPPNAAVTEKLISNV